MHATGDPELSALAVVLTYNAPESLERCLLAIAAQTTPPQAVLVVDAARDETGWFVLAHRP